MEILQLVKFGKGIFDIRCMLHFIEIRWHVPLVKPNDINGFRLSKQFFVCKGREFCRVTNIAKPLVNKLPILVLCGHVGFLMFELANLNKQTLVIAMTELLLTPLITNL